MVAIGSHDYNNVHANKLNVLFSIFSKLKYGTVSNDGIKRLRKNISGINIDFDQVVMLLLNSGFSCIYMKPSSVFAEVTFVFVPFKRNKIKR